jgi:hypothetical protein
MAGVMNEKVTEPILASGVLSSVEQTFAID